MDAILLATICHGLSRDAREIRDIIEQKMLTQGKSNRSKDLAKEVGRD
jgi:hypothetical protein